jgi:hypothetical protein
MIDTEAYINRILSFVESVKPPVIHWFIWTNGIQEFGEVTSTQVFNQAFL